MSDVQLQGSNGPVDCRIVGQTEVNGKPFIIADLGVGAYIKGVYTKLAVVPTHLILNRNVENAREE